jgi:hypothetical protein
MSGVGRPMEAASLLNAPERGASDYGHLPPGCRTDLGFPYVNCRDL